jgi:hypothetical protein
MVCHGRVIAGRESDWVMESSVIHHRASKQERIFPSISGLDCIWEAYYYEFGAWKAATGLNWGWDIFPFFFCSLFSEL